MQRIAAAVQAFLVVLFAFGVAAARDDLGPAVGSVIPHDLAAPDSTGAPQTFDSLVDENGMALFFIRSIDWCPYCQAQAIDINEHRTAFAERGLSVVFISYDAQDKQAKFVQRHDFAPTLLSDPMSEIIDAFGLRNMSYTSGKAAGAPHPAVFIVTPDRVIAAKLFEEDYATNDKSYQERPAVETILEAADAALASE